jgi:hypothetical protein
MKPYKMLLTYTVSGVQGLPAAAAAADSHLISRPLLLKTPSSSCLHASHSLLKQHLAVVVCHHHPPPQQSLCVSSTLPDHNAMLFFSLGATKSEI